MKRARHGQNDPMERQIEWALCPGEFIYDRAGFSFVSGLEKVAADVQKLIPAEPARAVALCEAFLAGCHAKAEQLDDSSGNFGMFVRDLICTWIKARQAAGVGQPLFETPRAKPCIRPPRASCARSTNWL